MQKALDTVLTSKSSVIRFSRWLDIHLKRPGLNLQAVAAQAGISPGYLSLLRHGARKVPSNKVLRGLAFSLDASVEEVFDVAEKPLEKATQYSESGTHGYGGRVQRCSVGTKNITLEAQINREKTGLTKVAIQFKTLTEQMPNECHLQWFIDSELWHESIAPSHKVILRLPASLHKIVGVWKKETITLEFSV